MRIDYKKLIFLLMLVVVVISVAGTFLLFYIWLTHYHTVLDRYKAAERSEKMENNWKIIESSKNTY